MTLFICQWDRVQQVCVEQIMLVIYSYIKISASAALWELILVANPAESTQIMAKCSHCLCIHIYTLHTHKLTHMYGWTKVVLLLKNLFFSRSAQRLHVHLISQMTQEHVKGLKSFLHSKRLPVLLRVWVGIKRSVEGAGRKWSNQVCKESLQSMEANFEAGWSESYWSLKLVSLFFFFLFFFSLVLSSERCLSYKFEKK